MSGELLTFGKYKGRPVSEADTDYLVWVLKEFDKPKWTSVARDELLSRGVATPMVPDNGEFTAVGFKLPNGRMDVVKVPRFTYKGSMPCDVERDIPQEDVRGKLDPDWDKAGAVTEALKQQARLGGDLVISEDAYLTLGAEYKIDLLCLNKNLRQAAVSLAQEAALYGVMEEEKWRVPGQTCVVSLRYQLQKWNFLLTQGAFPQLETVEISL